MNGWHAVVFWGGAPTRGQRTTFKLREGMPCVTVWPHANCAALYCIYDYMVLVPCCTVCGSGAGTSTVLL